MRREPHLAQVGQAGMWLRRTLLEVTLSFFCMHVPFFRHRHVWTAAHCIQSEKDPSCRRVEELEGKRYRVVAGVFDKEEQQEDSR